MLIPARISLQKEGPMHRSFFLHGAMVLWCTFGLSNLRVIVFGTITYAYGHRPIPSYSRMCFRVEDGASETISPKQNKTPSRPPPAVGTPTPSSVSHWYRGNTWPAQVPLPKTKVITLSLIKIFAFSKSSTPNSSHQEAQCTE